MSQWKKISFILGGIFILAGIGFLIYAEALHSPFQFDDYDYIIRNPSILSTEFFERIGNHWTFKKRVVGFLTFAWQYHRHGLNPFAFHTVNLIIHIINAMLVWLMVGLLVRVPFLACERTQWPRTCRGVPFITALLFLSHPVQTQAVTYISQRFTVLGACFYLISCCCYLKARLDIHEKGLGTAALFGFMIAALAAVLGMLTKENVFTLPLVLILIEFSFFPGIARKRFLTLTGFLLGFLLVIPFIYSFDLAKVFTGLYDEGITSGRYLLTQFQAVIEYIRLLVFPVGQCVDYDIPLASTFWRWNTGGNFVILLSIFISGLCVYRSRRLIGFGVVWFFLTLSVESSIIPIRDFVVEHRVYLPSIGFFLIASFALSRVFRRPWRFWLATFLLVLILGVLTYQRNQVWMSPFSLWKDALKQFPDNTRAIHNLGYHYLQEGDDEKAMLYFNETIKREPYHFIALTNRGSIYRKQGLLDRAMEDYNAAVRIRPKYHVVFLNRGNIFDLKGDDWHALADYSVAIDLKPDYALAYYKRANLYVRIKRYALAFDDYNYALKLDPNKAEIYNALGNFYRETGELHKSFPEYRKAMELQPDWPEPYNNFGVALTDLSLYEEAYYYFEKAIAIDPHYVNALHNMGRLLYLQKDYDLALKFLNRALSVFPLPETHSIRGFVFLETGKYKEAIDDYSRIIEIIGPEGQVLALRSQAYYLKGDLENAVADAKQALQFGYRPTGDFADILESLLFSEE